MNGTICHWGVAPATRSFNAGCHPEEVKSQRTPGPQKFFEKIFGWKQCCDLTTRGDPGLLECATLSHRFFIDWIATSRASGFAFHASWTCSLAMTKTRPRFCLKKTPDFHQVFLDLETKASCFLMGVEFGAF